MKGGVLILTAGFGEGHNAAARALKAAIETLHGPGHAGILDVFAEARPLLNRWMRAGYLGVINQFPRIWSGIYEGTNAREVPVQFWREAFQKEAAHLEACVRALRPSVLCSTYPVYSFFIKHLHLEEAGRLPHYNVVTDSISVHSLWWQAGADGWFLPNEDSAQVLRQAAVSEERLVVSGFPVSLLFAENRGKWSPPDLSRGARPRVLFLAHSGNAKAYETARRLLARSEWDITCAVGRNASLRARLEEEAGARRDTARILGWTPDIPELLMTHHVVVSKAGGATTQEAIAACCPMVVNQIVPGQEEGNFELLRRLGAGSHAGTPAEVVGHLEQTFMEGGRLWQAQRAALQRAAQPEAALEIARRLLPPPKAAAEENAS